MTTKVVQLLCIIMAFGFLFAGGTVIALSGNDLVAGTLIFLAIFPLVRACLYPRTYNRCRICGAKVHDEGHHQIAHAMEHVRRGGR
jgi:hypothetical protein